MNSFTSHPIKKIEGVFSPPGDKSISHRAMMLGALARGESTLTHFLEADDCLRTIDAFREMGVPIEKKEDVWHVLGRGFEGLKAPSQELYLGNSGTSMRLLLGVLASQNFKAVLTGDDSLSRRPMRRVTVPLRKMGAHITGREDGNFAPLHVTGSKLKGIVHVNEPPSAQVKSGILLAGLRAEGQTVIREPILSRDHTERMLLMFGANLRREGHDISLDPTGELKPVRYEIPGDISSAAFLIVGAAVLPGSDLLVEKVGLNPTRTGILDVLHDMGADIKWKVCGGENEEPVGEIRVRGSSLRGVTISKDMIPKLIDEIPTLMIACALAEGESVIRDAHELRVKETDRIKSMVAGINSIGGHAQEREDGCVIEGSKSFRGGKALSYGDHRTAMSFIVAGLKSVQGVLVEDTACINTSYPGFFRDLADLSQV